MAAVKKERVNRDNSRIMAFRLPRELVADFRRAAQRELGDMPYGGSRDRASRIVLERLIREYLESKQAEATGSQPEGDLASRMVSACPECGRRGYHLVRCSLGRPMP